jgi:hypothetical protein
VSDVADGPWVVSDARPKDVENIPAPWEGIEHGTGSNLPKQ